MFTITATYTDHRGVQPVEMTGYTTFMQASAAAELLATVPAWSAIAITGPVVW